MKRKEGEYFWRDHLFLGSARQSEVSHGYYYDRVSLEASGFFYTITS
jgi:hypothetical protein